MKNESKGAEAVLPEPATERAMVQAVIDERRKELISGFSRFWDLKRYNTEADYAKTITRTFPLVSTDVEKKDIYVEAGFTVVYHSIPVGCP